MNPKACKQAARQSLQNAEAPHRTAFYFFSIYYGAQLLFFLLDDYCSAHLAAGLSGLSRATSYYAFSACASLLLSLASLVFLAGYRYRYGLRLARGEQTCFEDFFRVFTSAPRVIFTTLLIALYSFFWFFLFLIPALLVLSSCFSSLVTLSASMTQAQILDAFANAAAAVWRMPLFWVSVLLALLGCAAALCRCYQYRMSLYFVLDQGLSSLAALRASKAAMRGNRRALFLLDLRFLPYLFLLFLPQLLSQLQSYEILQLSFAGPQSLLIYNLIVTCYAIAICTWQTPLYTAAQAHAYTEIIRSAPQDFEFPGR